MTVHDVGHFVVEEGEYIVVDEVDNFLADGLGYQKRQTLVKANQDDRYSL